MSTLTDSRTLYIMPRHLTEEQVYETFVKSLELMRDVHGVDFTKSKFYVKVLKGNTPSTGYGYIRVTDSGLYNCIVGKNPDGTSRTRFESSEPVRETDYEFVDGCCAYLETYGKTFENIKQYINEFNYSHPNVWDEQIHDQVRGTEVHDPPLFEMLDYHEDGTPISIEPAYVKLNDYHINSEMYACNVPSSINVAHIKKLFEPFSTVSSTAIRTIGDHARYNETYPHISKIRNANRSDVVDILVSFHPRSNDGYFAMLVQKQCVINNTVLYFARPTPFQSRNGHTIEAEKLGFLGTKTKAH